MKQKTKSEIEGLALEKYPYSGTEPDFITHIKRDVFIDTYEQSLADQNPGDLSELRKAFVKAWGSLNGHAMFDWIEKNIPISISPSEDKDKWVSVEDDLPTNSQQHVLVHNGGLFPTRGYYFNNEWHVFFFGGCEVDNEEQKVTHWQPLPNAPTLQTTK